MLDTLFHVLVLHCPQTDPYVTQSFTNSLVAVIFLIYLFVGTFRLSSYARLEAFVNQTFVIQTKLN